MKKVTWHRVYDDCGYLTHQSGQYVIEAVYVGLEDIQYNKLGYRVYIGGEAVKRFASEYAWTFDTLKEAKAWAESQMAE